MRMTKDKLYLIGAFAAISVLFLYLRLKTIGHPLMWDEAWNILALRAFLLNAVKDPFYWFYRFHPPLYMVFAKLLYPFRAGLDMRLEFLSLFSAYAALAAVYLVSSRMGGWKYACLSGLFLSVMPVSLGYDTWIKRDGLASAFGYFSILLLLKRKYLWCGVLLSLSLLSKESGLFFILSAVLLIFMLGEIRPFKQAAVLLFTVFALTSWWFLFFSEMTTHGPGFFFTHQEYSMLWAGGPLYYFKKLLPDLGVGILIFLIIGIVYIIRKVIREKRPRRAVPLVIASCVYIPISFLFTLKVPWLSLPASGALAMIAASGGMCLFEKSKNLKFLKVIAFSLLALVIFSGGTFSCAEYHAKTYPNGWPGALSSKRIAEYLRENVKSGEKVMITDFSYWQMPVCPVFLYYSKPLDIKCIKGTEGAGEVIEMARENNISWLVVVGSPDPKADPSALISGLKKSLGEPETVAWSLIWHLDLTHMHAFRPSKNS